METEKVIRAMEAKGYTVTDESGVLIFTGVFDCIDDSISDIKKNLDALEFRGSWGTKGLPKGVKRKETVSSAPVSAPVSPVTEDPDESDPVSSSAIADPDESDSVSSPALSSSDDFTQLSFDFLS